MDEFEYIVKYIPIHSNNFGNISLEVYGYINKNIYFFPERIYE